MDLHWIISKAAAAITGLLGGFALSVFWLPAELKNRSGFIQGIIIGGVSVAIPLVSTTIILRQLGLDLNNLDNIMFLSFIEGMGALGLINWIANFFEKRQNSDIKNVIDEIRGKTNNE